MIHEIPKESWKVGFIGFIVFFGFCAGLSTLFAKTYWFSLAKPIFLSISSHKMLVLLRLFKVLCAEI